MAERKHERRELEDGQWNGQERRGNLFSDAQIEWLDQHHEDRDNIKMGKASARLILLALGAVGSAAIGAVIAFFGLKH